MVERLYEKNPGLEYYNEIIAGRLEKDNRTTRILADKSLIPRFSIVEESPIGITTRVENVSRIAVSEKDYFVETRYSHSGLREYRVYDEARKLLLISYDLIEMMKSLGNIKLKKS